MPTLRLFPSPQPPTRSPSRSQPRRPRTRSEVSRAPELLTHASMLTAGKCTLPQPQPAPFQRRRLQLPLPCRLVSAPPSREVARAPATQSRAPSKATSRTAPTSQLPLLLNWMRRTARLRLLLFSPSTSPLASRGPPSALAFPETASAQRPAL